MPKSPEPADVILSWQKRLADVILVKDLKWGRLSYIISWFHQITWVWKTEEPFPVLSERGVTMIRDTTLLTLKKKGSHKPKNMGASSRKANGFSSRACRKRNSSAHTLILSSWEPSQTTTLQNCKVTNLRCFKPLMCSNVLQQHQETNIMPMPTLLDLWQTEISYINFQHKYTFTIS